MKASKNCVEMIKRFESLRLNAYKCPAGVWTIGYGHTGSVSPRMSISPDTAEQFLINDLRKFEAHVNSINDKYGYKFNQNEFDSLVSFAFNIGSINQLTANGKRDKKTIAEKMLLYVKAGGKTLKGLQTRRKAEHDLFIKNVSRETSKSKTKEGK